MIAHVEHFSMSANHKMPTKCYGRYDGLIHYNIYGDWQIMLINLLHRQNKCHVGEWSIFGLYNT